jgi:capsular exopolysaccharide synthesis family protein
MAQRRKKHSSSIDHPLGLISANPKSGVAEAYRSLRTNIQFYNLGERMRRLLVTSSGPNEGKSTTSANLAITFAQAGNQVILLDADLRRPFLHRVFQVSNLVGLTNVMVGEATLEEAIRSTEVPGLSLLTSGPIPPNPAEMLGSTRMRELLDQLADLADVVIIDSPPVIAVTDASVLAPLVDGVILVAGAGLVNRDMAQRAKAQLEAVRAKVLGVVLNGVEVEGSGYYYYYYYGEKKR